MKDKPRIGTGHSYDRAEIFNGNYTASGVKVGDFERPWNLFTPDGGATFATHAEAIHAATSQEAGNK